VTRDRLNLSSDPRSVPLTEELNRHLGASRSLPDLEDLRRRTRGRERVRRFAVGVVGVLLGVVSIGVAAAALNGSPHDPQANASILPEGEWLLQGSGSGSLSKGVGSIRDFSGVWVQDYSEARGQLLALTQITTDVTGLDAATGTIRLTRRDSLLMIQPTTGRSTVLAELPANATFGEPAEWSASGKYAIVEYGRWDQPVVEGAPHPGEVSLSTFCAVEVDTQNLRCFDDLSPITTFAPHPTDESVAVARGTRIELVSLDAGSASKAVALATREEVDAELLPAGLGEIRAVTDLEWAPSGRFLSMLATTTRAFSVPLILDVSTDSITAGEPNNDSQVMAWSPTDDVLAYGTGVADPDVQPMKASNLHFLDPLVGNEETIDVGLDAFVADLDWSPSGKWLAVSSSPWGASDIVLIVDAEGRSVRSQVSIDEPADLSPLVEWLP
jgi:WD40 repeat protein